MTFLLFGKKGQHQEKNYEFFFKKIKQKCNKEKTRSIHHHFKQYDISKATSLCSYTMDLEKLGP